MSHPSSRRDRREKLDLFALHGVREYWIIDPTNRLVWVMQLQDGVLEIDQTCADGDSADSAVIEGFGIEVADLFVD